MTKWVAEISAKEVQLCYFVAHWSQFRQSEPAQRSYEEEEEAPMKHDAATEWQVDHHSVHRPLQFFVCEVMYDYRYRYDSDAIHDHHRHRR
jgi:hypothetical protein